MKRRRFRFVLATVILVLLPAAGHSQNTLPSQISDAEFWQLIEKLSEPSGTFGYENFVTNEIAFQEIIPAMRQAIKPDGVYVGVGPEQNFTYIVALKPKIAFILDIRRQNLQEHLLYKALFELSENRAKFLAQLFSRKLPAGFNDQSSVKDLFDAIDGAGPDEAMLKKTLQNVTDLLVSKHKFGLSDSDRAGIEHVLRAFSEYGSKIDYNSTYPRTPARGGGLRPFSYRDAMTATDLQKQEHSYLASEESYRAIRSMEAKNLVIPIVGDFGGPKAVRAVGQYVRDHGALVTAFYVSNVEIYLLVVQKPDGFQNGGSANFYESLATLPFDSSGMVIRNTGASGKTHVAPIQATVDAFKAGKLKLPGDFGALTR